jgi:hypothetical protein
VGEKNDRYIDNFQWSKPVLKTNCLADNGSQILPHEICWNRKFVADFCRLNAVSRENANFQISIGLSGLTVGLCYKYDCC